MQDCANIGGDISSSDDETKKIPLWIDCDTGVDDAIALLAASAMERFDLVGVSTVAGNVSLDRTTPNTLNVLALAGRTDVPVYRGAAAPLVRSLVTAPQVHGLNGLGGAEIPESSRNVEAVSAWDALHEAAVAHRGELALVAIGPLTNIALTLAKYGDLSDLLGEIVIMGGAAVGGNATPAAEFNIVTDPEAADMLFNCGVPIAMCGLDVTLKAYLTAEELDELGALGTPQAAFARECQLHALAYGQSVGLPGICLHDPAALFFAEDESMFTARRAGVRVETHGLITTGKTVTDLDSDRKMGYREHRVVLGIDRAAFKKRLFDLIAGYGSDL